MKCFYCQQDMVLADFAIDVHSVYACDSDQSSYCHGLVIHKKTSTGVLTIIKPSGVVHQISELGYHSNSREKLFRRIFTVNEYLVAIEQDPLAIKEYQLCAVERQSIYPFATLIVFPVIKATSDQNAIEILAQRKYTSAREFYVPYTETWKVHPTKWSTDRTGFAGFERINSALYISREAALASGEYDFDHSNDIKLIPMES